MRTAKLSHYSWIVLFFLSFGICFGATHRTNIEVRDPFIVFAPEDGKYYMTGTYHGTPGAQILYYSSTDLEFWEGPFIAFDPLAGFWTTEPCWGPKLHKFNGQYYIFGTYIGPGGAPKRGVQVFISTTGLAGGPYVEHSSGTITPSNYDALDGDLFIDDQGTPWMFYCREWTNSSLDGDGQMRVVKLKADLSDVASFGVFDYLLFNASDAPWVAPDWAKITDGPHVYKAANGQLVMLWSSFTDYNEPGSWDYAIGIARSPSGSITGPWQHDSVPFIAVNGGNGTHFQDAEGHYKLAMHRPNDVIARPVILDLYEIDNTWSLTDPQTRSSTVAYWSFEEGSPPYTAPSGGIDVLDYSGHGNHLHTDSDDTAGVFTAYGISQQVPQIKKKSYIFYDNSVVPGGSSVTRNLHVAHGTLNQSSFDAWTIEAMIYQVTPTSGTGGYQTFIGRDGALGVSNMSAAVYFQIDSNQKLAIRFWQQDGVQNNLTSNLTITSGKIYHVAAVSTGDSLKMYIDSLDGNGYVLDNEVALTGNTAMVANNGLWTIGRGQWNGWPADHFLGLMDEIRISDAALDPTDFLFYEDHTCADFGVYLQSDFNTDCYVDINDLVLFSGNWLTHVPLMDYNGDNILNLEDMAQFAMDWLKCNDPEDINCLD